MDIRKFLNILGFHPKNGTSEVYCKKYSLHNNYSLNVDFGKEIIDYGAKIKADSKTTQNFSQPENFVVLECVNRLLEKGYKPQNIVLEKTWPAGHGTSGRLDICVTRNDGTEYMLIECKTFGKEFDKELLRMNKDGGQLFTYFKFSSKADVIMLYASELQAKEIVYRNEIIKIEEDYRSGDVNDFYDKWNKLTNNNGIFDDWVEPYNFENKALTIRELKDIKQEDSSFIFNRFLEILRHNVVSDKPNAFNKIFTLFLCKIYDEKNNEGTDNELSFQWKEGTDNDVDFQIRLTDLYKKGMLEFLEKNVTDFSESEFEKKYKNLSEAVKNALLQEFKKIRLEKNNEFAIKEVYDEKSFKENAKVVKQVVELLQNYKIRYTKKQQYLSDFFEMLLTTGLKQESGQFFTPVPIAQFIIKSLPIDTILDAKLKEGKRDELLPYIIDYAAGSGHFLTESMHEIQRLLNKVDTKKLKADTRSFVDIWRIRHFDWALQYVYGIEKDYRLVKVGKVGCYLHGDGLANVIHSDGLSNFKHSDYKNKLKETNNDFSKDNKQFDVVVSNPPYSVSAFKNAAREYYGKDDFELYERLTDNSSEIECLFIERTKQLLKDGGVAGVILPSSILSNTGIYTKAREIILQYFDIIAVTELGSNTFMATGTNTVVLFLRRRNNYDSINLRKSVDRFFTTLQDVTLNGVEKPIAKYVSYAWDGISFKDYISLLQKTPNKSVEGHELYKEYRKKLKFKTEKDFWNLVIERENERLYYFILTYSQKVVLVKTGKKNAEKRFLGYKFSKRRGCEGIHSVQRGKPIDECTKLFDPEVFDNLKKASTYIYKAFAGDLDLTIDQSMRENVHRTNLVDMMTFDRIDFEKSISLSVKKKVKIEKVWTCDKLVSLSDIAHIQKGTSITEEKTVKGSIPVIAGGQGVAYYHNTPNRSGEIITISASGAYSGFVNYFNRPIFASDCNTVQSKDVNSISTKLIYHFLKSMQNEIYGFQEGQSQPHVYAKDIAKIKIPLPSKNIQTKIVSEIEEIEAKETVAKDEITKSNNEIEELFSKANQLASKEYRLSDSDVFSISIGKRVVANDLVPHGTIPVYSANVFEPFGNIDKLLVKDFDIPSVLWGIDGDWMVNYIRENIPFYPTDHCGVLRVIDKNVLPKYVAWILRKEGQNVGFSRQLRASIDRIAGISIKVPTISKQREVVSKIELLEKQIAGFQEIVNKSEAQKKEVLKKYL